ncbi:MAG: ABC transporter permease [Anaerolineae bacterium]|uniref:ABC transporter permease n=1 Tax=Thermogutta sp. TaxID=1962930 RepID=UPI0032204E15
MATLIRYVRDLFNLPGVIRNLVRHRELIRVMTWRNFSARYRGSFGGLFWSVFQPMVMMVIYTVVFSLFLKVRFSTDASPFTFAVYLLCGLLPWQAFSEGVHTSAILIRANANLVKRVVFPLEILPVNLTLAAIIQQFIGMVLLVPLAWLVTGHLHVTLLFVPVILALQVLFSTGVNWIVASLAVYLPDMGPLISLVLTAWMFLTPIFYPEDVVPPQAIIIFRLNPMARLVNLYRNAFMIGLLPDLRDLLGTIGVCLLTFLVGYFWFMRLKKGFADVL